MSERPLSGRKVILRPERLSADFEQVNGTLLLTLRWRLSQHALQPAAVEGFQFTWSLLSKVKSAKEGLEDTVISQTQTVAPVRDSAALGHLQNTSDLSLQAIGSDTKKILVSKVSLQQYTLNIIVCKNLVDRSLWPCHCPIYSGSDLYIVGLLFTATQRILSHMIQEANKISAVKGFNCSHVQVFCHATLLPVSVCVWFLPVSAVGVRLRSSG